MDPAAEEIVARYFRRPVEELYDLNADPDERHNLAADAQHSQTLNNLRTTLDKWMRDQGDEGLATEALAAKSFPKALAAPVKALSK